MFRTVLALAVLLAPALLFIWEWPVPAPLTVPVVAELSPQQPVVIPMPNGRSEFEVDFQRHSRYLLIVSALGMNQENWNVQLTARAGKAGKPQEFASLTSLPALPRWTTPVRSQETDRVSVAAVTPAKALRSFFLHVTDGPLDNPLHYAEVKARLIGEGASVRIYLDTQIREVNLHKRLVPELIRLFDEEVLPASRANLGEFLDVDQDGKFAILLSPWLERLQGGKTSLGGFVRGSDFHSEIKPPFSNRCDVLYLNSKVSPGPELRSLLAHEFAHAVCFSERRRQSSSLVRAESEEDWLNEAIAHLAENLHGRDFSNLDYRISRFLSSPQSYRLVVPDYYRAGLWRNHGCRGATYLFLRWCVDVYGEELLSRLIHSPLSGRKNLEQATGQSFAELYRHWTIALWQSGPGGISEEQRNSSREFLRWVTLDEPLEEYQLCGPRPLCWELRRPHCELQLQPTTTAFVVLESPGPGNELQRVQVLASPEAHLQLTLIPLDDLKALPVQTDYLHAEPIVGEVQQMVSGDNPYPHLPVSIQVRIPPEFQIDAIGLECHEGEVHRGMRFQADELKEYRVDRDRCENGLEESYRLPGFRPSSVEQTWLVKVVAKSPAGDKVAGWSDLVVPARAPIAPKRTAQSEERSAYR